jgi:hypothetical protein
MKIKWLLPIVCLALVGCEEQPKTDKIAIEPKVAPSTNQVEKVERFTITSKGTFRAGYDSAAREIFILRDNDSGDEYLGITDCTVIKIKKKKDEAADAAIDTALDVIGSIAEAAGD